jgi:hypothetical protein
MPQNTPLKGGSPQQSLLSFSVDHTIVRIYIAPSSVFNNDLFCVVFYVVLCVVFLMVNTFFSIFPSRRIVNVTHSMPVFFVFFYSEVYERASAG